MLYSSLIRDMTVFENTVEFPYVPSLFRFEDIYKMYVNGTEQSKATANSILDNTFYKSYVTVAGETQEAMDIYPHYDEVVDVRILYFARPIVKTSIRINSANAGHGRA